MGDPSGIGKNCLISPTRVVFWGTRRSLSWRVRRVWLSITMSKTMGKFKSPLQYILVSGLNIVKESDLFKLVRMAHVSPGKTGRSL